jgi:7,8-dihydropterin-6-yl-methyl-4-(beta-D-ribofuranosyl)aminobenzene 5'-phosphate synthase
MLSFDWDQNSAQPIILAGLMGCSSPTEQNNDQNSPAQTQYSLTLTILYDNTVFRDGTTADWGFSCLVEGMEDTILFDTGTQGSILQHNIDQLNVDISTIDQIVLSHHHLDHTGGIGTILNQNSDLTVNVPQSFEPEFINNVSNTGATVATHLASETICGNVCLTGEMGEAIKEQSLIVDTDSGLVVITGCSHPGIVEILQRAQQVRNRPIYLVLGGFHLLAQGRETVEDIIQEFQNMNIKHVAPTHCTGEQQIAAFRAAYGNNFVYAGTGKIIHVR